MRRPPGHLTNARPKARRDAPKRDSRPQAARGNRKVDKCKRRNHSERFDEQLRIKQRLAETLELVGLHRAAEKVRDCYAHFAQHRCSNGHLFLRSTDHCRNRLCPFCQKDVMKRYLARYGWFIDSLAKRHRGKYIVLAMKNTPVGFLGLGVDDLWAAFKRLQRMPGMAGLKNALVKLELTWNAEERSWHPHLNVVCVSSYIPFKKLNAAWRKASNGGRTTWIEEVNSGTARELLKYVCKSADFVDDPEAVEEFVQTMRRRHILRRYGSFAKLGKPGDESGALGDGNSLRCPDCGSFDVQPLSVVVGLNSVLCDQRGVLRIRAPALD